MKEKTVYVNQWQGKVVNDGLSEDAPVLTKKRALEISAQEKNSGTQDRRQRRFQETILSDSF